MSLGIVGSNPNRLALARTASAHYAADELDAFINRIDTTITLGAWLKSHPSDVVSDSIPYHTEIEEVCRTARSSVSISGRRATRWAVFTIPRPTPDETLPEGGEDVAERVCHLRALWLVAEEPDSARASSFASSLARLIEARLGKTTSTKRGGSGYYAWIEKRTWVGPGGTLVLGINPSGDRGSRSVRILAFAPYGGFDELGGPDDDRATAYFGEEEAWETKWSLAKMDSALARVTIPSIAADLRLVISGLQPKGWLDTAPSPASVALVRAAAAIRDRAPTLDPASRAALLLAGDLVLERAAPAFEINDTTTTHYRLFKALVAAGVEYGGEAYMVGRPYARAWLWEAYRLDSLGTTGHAAYLELLAGGWQTGEVCGSETVDKTGLIIEHAEAAMRRSDIDPLIQYYIGIAYQDRFSVARGDYFEGNSGAESHTPQTEEARVRAISWLRTSLLSLKVRHLRRDAWRTAMRLMLGKTNQPRYFCFPD